MRKYEKKLVKEEKQVLTELICNMCGEEFSGIKENLPGVFKYSGGYKDRFDGIEWNTELCDSCCLKIFDTINSGDGPGVEAENVFGPCYPDRDADVLYAPIDLNTVEYIGDYTCLYHDDENLILTESGLVCPRKGCPTKQEYVFKDVLIISDNRKA